MKFLKGTFVKAPNGRLKKVKNLGWLLAHWKQVESFRAVCGDSLDGYLTADLRDGGQYLSHFASFDVLLHFLDRPVFKDVEIEIAYPSDYMANEVHTKVGSPKFQREMRHHEQLVIQMASAANRRS